MFSFTKLSPLRRCVHPIQTNFATPRKWLPAAEIENFAVERITTIGKDESFVRSIVEKAASMAEEMRAVLEAERDHIEKSLRGQARLVASCVGQPNAVSRLADLESQIRAGENRLAEIVRELATLDRMDVTAADVATVLGGFREFFDRLSRDEAAEVVAALVDEVVYDREKGTVAISFHPSCIKTLAEEKA
jgi:site-specific DNA recombinase